MGFTRTMRNEGQSDASRLQEQENDYLDNGLRLLDKWDKTKGMGFEKGELLEMADKNVFNAIGLATLLENTERGFVHKLKEYQTSSYMGVTPQEIVRVFRFAYGNAVAPDLFNFWTMNSVKDTFYKIETKYKSTSRGATAGEVIYENYGDGGRYPTSFGEDTFTGDGSTLNFTGTLTTVPVLAYSFKIFSEVALGGIIGGDDGNGNITAIDGTSFTGTINYTTGDYDITFVTAPVSTVVTTIQYNFDLEQESLFGEVDEVSLGLVAFDYRCRWHSMKASWSRFSEEVSESKLGRSARQDLLDGVGDVIRKSMDEFFTKQMKRASNWAAAIEFDTNFANAGVDSGYARAQDLFSTLEDARGVTYASLGRYPARTNLLVGYKAKAYLRKLNGYNVNKSNDEIGFFKDGDVGGYGVYVAPPDVVDSGDIYLIGRGKDNLSTDAVISVGMYKGELNSDELEYASFKNEVGLGYMLDHKISNKYMCSKVELKNL